MSDSALYQEGGGLWVCRDPGLPPGQVGNPSALASPHALMSLGLVINGDIFVLWATSLFVLILGYLGPQAGQRGAITGPSHLQKGIGSGRRLPPRS